MRALKSISLFLAIGGVFFLGGFYICQMQLNSNNEKKNIAEKEVLTVNEGKKVTTCDTRYYVCYIDKDTHTETESEEKIPLYFIGLEREALEETIAGYQSSPSLTDLEKGFLSMELVSFHPDEVHVRKTYQKIEKQNIYYMELKNHKIVVYQNDEDTIFMTTEIDIEQLPDDVEQEILHVKCFNDIESLYDFLESYSS